MIKPNRMCEESGSGRVQEEIRKELLNRLEDEGELTDEDILVIIDDLVLREGGKAGCSLRQKEELRKELFYSVRRLDVLQELMDDPDITEIMANGYKTVFYEKGGKIYKWNKKFTSRERFEDVIQQIAGRCNRVVNEQRPIADARLADGSRVNIVMDPVALNGPVLTIRRFPEKPITMPDLVKCGSITEEACSLLRNLVEARYSILIGGGTSTGKTTFLNALSSFIPQDERIITIEDNAELQIQGVDNLVKLEARSASLDGGAAITIRDLIKSALRMRPDRIIVGEVRGAEAEDFLVCLNTGHSGSLGTAHANSTEDMIGRLEMMVLMGAELPIPVIRRQIASGIEILIHLARDGRGRRMVQEISEITGCGGDGTIRMHPVFRRNQEGILEKRDSLVNTEKLEKLNAWRTKKN